MMLFVANPLEPRNPVSCCTTPCSVQVLPIHFSNCSVEWKTPIWFTVTLQTTLRSCKSLLLSLLPNSESDNREQSHQGQMLFLWTETWSTPLLFGSAWGHLVYLFLGKSASCGQGSKPFRDWWCTLNWEHVYEHVLCLKLSHSTYLLCLECSRLVILSLSGYVFCSWHIADAPLTALLATYSINSDVLLDGPQPWQPEQNEYLVQLSLCQATCGHSWLLFIHEEFQSLLIWGNWLSHGIMNG